MKGRLQNYGKSSGKVIRRLSEPQNTMSAPKNPLISIKFNEQNKQHVKIPETPLKKEATKTMGF